MKNTKQRFFLPFFLPFWLILFLLPRVALASDDVVAFPSHYQPSEGENFFLLSEKSFGSEDVATVRLEVVKNSFNIEQYGGVDVAIYRVSNPISFLQAQKNLHRIVLSSRPEAEGLANALRLSWDKIWANTRFAWRRIFSGEARLAVTTAAPQLKTPAAIFDETKLYSPPAYAPIHFQGITRVDSFRYPVQSAKSIPLPQGVKLEGSSSGFLPLNEGNVYLPIGKRPPGLYLVEAFVGKYRALTLVFVGDSVVATKNTSQQMFVWAAHRETGAPVAGADVFWSDGVGILKSGKTDQSGVATLLASSPETSFVFGTDPAGGVFISENFYHDSEIYNTKLLAITDRPLYRPGDTVLVKILGRDFKNARHSLPVNSQNIKLSLFDPAGTEVLKESLSYDAATGGNTQFRLPLAAEAGGWEMVFAKGEDTYSAPFRVANYVKPHFEIDVAMDKSDFRTKEPVTGRVQLLYPDGKPVANAKIHLQARSEALSMVQGELGYGGQAPLVIQGEEYKTDSKGIVLFSLPAAIVPARYLLSVLAEDGAAYRVRGNKEILIERGATLWQLTSNTRFSSPGTSVNFRFLPQGTHTTSSDEASRPVRWETIRLEDQRHQEGAIESKRESLDTKADGGEPLAINFQEPGSYTVNLRDAKGALVAGTSHWVSGPGLLAAPGSVEIVLNKNEYQAGEVAEALITFPEVVENALLTLERDTVEAHAILSIKNNRSADWVSLTQVAPKQWKAKIPVTESAAPNLNFSVLYVRQGDYVFQNKGIVVAVQKVDILMKTLRPRYAPGERVTIDIETKVAGKSTPALVNIGVVDEMIYVLQPEISPTMSRFFYAPRRNNVRTAVSLSFIGYDMARKPDGKGQSIRRNLPMRAVKVLERPRRDDTDTAGWWPALMTDANGKASLSFTMPDSLTRWRVTARAMTAKGVVGQQVAHVESHKDFYAKWSGPTRFRQGDKPTTTLLLFNQTGVDAKVSVMAIGAGFDVKREMTLHAGANVLALPLDLPKTGDVAVSLIANGNQVDEWKQSIQVDPALWLSDRAKILSIAPGQTITPLSLPADAESIRVSMAEGAAGNFLRITGDLVDYPWGCVEQTASRLLPLSLLYRSLPADSPRLREIAQILSTERLRLIQMAGPDAAFSWWGRGTAESGWLTAYAYFADYEASRVLGIKLPEEHWREALSAYAKYGKEEPLRLSTLSVFFLAQMNLPVKNLVEDLVQRAGGISLKTANAPENENGSLWLGSTPENANPLTLLLIEKLARREGIVINEKLALMIEEAKAWLKNHPTAQSDAFFAQEDTTKNEALKESAAKALSSLAADTPTLDRAIALFWWHKALDGALNPDLALPLLTGDWVRSDTALGRTLWRWTSEKLPDAIPLSTGSASPLTAMVYYRSHESPKGKLPVHIKRTLYRLLLKEDDKTPAKKADGRVEKQEENWVAKQSVFRAEAANDNDIRSNVLYMDEISITPKNEKISEALPRYGLLEVPLPPGAEVERGTWGIRLNATGGNDVVEMDRARAQTGDKAYGVPIDDLSKPVVVRHLVRFGSRGQFVLPPVKFQNLYQPEDAAFEQMTSRQIQVK